MNIQKLNVSTFWVLLETGILLHLSVDNQELLKVSLEHTPTCFHADLNLLAVGTESGKVCLVYFREREVEQFELDLKNLELLKSPSKSSS